MSGSQEVKPKTVSIGVNNLLLAKFSQSGGPVVKNLPAMQKTWVRFLGWEDPWRRDWQSILVFLPREFLGQKSLEGYSTWGHKELYMTEQLTLTYLLK